MLILIAGSTRLYKVNPTYAREVNENKLYFVDLKSDLPKTISRMLLIRTNLKRVYTVKIINKYVLIQCLAIFTLKI